MKKALLALIGAALFTFNTQAQNTSTENRKATAGNIALEANLNLFDGSNISLSNSLNQIKGRYFLSDDMAVRLGVNINYQNFTQENNPSPIRSIERKSLDISLNPGIEKHFAGTERLSPYVGAELSLQHRGASSTTTLNNDNVIETENGWDNGTNRGYLGVGLNGVAGFDYYLARNFFVGYELGLGLLFRNEKDIETNTNGNITKSEGNNSTFFGPMVLNGIRVGFVLK